MLPTQTATAGGLTLIYQNDGNLVLYRGAPVWAAMVFASPGYLEMQGDGNLVAYDAAGAPYWATNTFATGAALHLDATGMRVVAPVTLWETPTIPPGPMPGPGAVRPIVGKVRPIGNSFGDDSGPRVLHGCSDFGAIAKFYQDRDGMLRQLDVLAQHQQYVRVLWRLNGTLWAESGVTNDPIRDPWFDEACLGYLRACHERGIRVNLSSGDFYNWTHAQSTECFERVGHIAASVSPDLVWLSAATNEMRGTMPGGESSENVAWMAECLDAFTDVYPWALLAGSDPGSQDKAGMKRLAPAPANVALIHDVRWSTDDALRRAFNTRYENYPGLPIVQDEPTGPENPAPPGEFTRKVYQPTENLDALFALYTMHVLTGQASTYFNDPALYSRRPLDETWGFKELPQLWRDLELPEDIGQGILRAGHADGAPLRVVDSHAARADSAMVGAYGLGVISGAWDGQPWAVRAGYDATYSVWYSTGKHWEGPLSEGQVIPTRQGFSPAVVRILS